MPKVQNDDAQDELDDLVIQLKDLSTDVKDTAALGLEACNNPNKVAVFQARLSRIDSTHDKFLDTLSKIRRVAKKLNASVTEYETLKTATRNSFYEALSIKIAPQQSATQSENKGTELERTMYAPNSYPRLPTINIPTFSGDISLWQSFKDTFSSLIHNNESLEDVQKFHYLRSSLKGPAAQLISGIDISQAGYTQAWVAITKRYDSQRIQATFQLTKLLNFKPITKGDLNSLERFSAVVLESGIAFRKLNVTDPAGFILTTMALRLLDSKSREQFELEHGADQDVPTWELFTKFLQQQITRLQSSALLGNTTEHAPNVANAGFGISKRPKQVLLSSESPISSTSSAYQCFLCKTSHRIYDCVPFRSLSPKQRSERIKALKRCFNCLASGHGMSACPSKNRCKHCSKKHHSLLHQSGSIQAQAVNPRKNVSENTSCGRQSALQQSSVKNTNPNLDTKENQHPSPPDHSAILASSSVGHMSVLLGTADARILDQHGTFHSIRLLVDSGSQRSFITTECVQRIELPISRIQHKLVGFGNQAMPDVKYQASCVLTPQHSPTPELRTSAMVVDRICQDMPTCKVPDIIAEHFHHLDLADPSFCQPGPIDFLVGADLFGEILLGENIKATGGFPSVLKTVFGWIILGPTSVKVPVPEGTVLHGVTECQCTDLVNVMSKFWEVETIKDLSVSDPRDKECEQHFISTHSRDQDGRYIVRLPFKTKPADLKGSQFGALRRFKKLEEKLERDPSLKIEYSRVFREYIDKDYISPAIESGKNYLPHHAVLKDSTSTKLRIVFDASAPTNNGSLNDHLFTGPKLQRDIRDVMLNFRFYPVAMTADICQMYSQIRLSSDDCAYQHLYYRFQTTDSLQEFVFKRLSFGLSCSPFLAIRVLHQLIEDEGNEFPRASQAIRGHMYVDDLLTGAPTISEALNLQNELIALLGKGCFQLKKWSSNAIELLENVPTEDTESSVSLSNLEDSVVKILGMQWDPKKDVLSYRVQSKDCSLTKRGILSIIARMYDPLGYLSPVIFKAKTILQRLWELKLDWDSPIPTQLAEKWEAFYRCLPRLSEISIPRCLFADQPLNVTVAGFADASSLGYAAVLYIHVELSNGKCVSRILYSKTRLAPLKPLSIPRLELCAAVLLVDALMSLKAVVSSCNASKVVLFTDSTIVLSWLRLPFSRLKTFVANRVAKILEGSSITSWYHVDSKHNAADLASRGLNPAELLNNTHWWEGPEWLQHPLSEWPLNDSLAVDTSQLPETKAEDLSILLSAMPDREFLEYVERFSSYTKLINTTAYILRFVHNTRVNSQKYQGQLSLSEIRNASELLLRSIQQLYKISPLDHKAKELKALCPFTDAAGLVRVGGRLSRAPLSQDAKHPILLPAKSHLVNLLVDNLHKTYLHAGPQLLLSLIRQKYWIISGKGLVRSRVHSCSRCHRLRVKAINPFMADLPLSRFEQGRPFLNTGVDFAGPFAIKESHRRKAALGKSYICLFICFATKAIHIEVVTEMGTEAFLACLNRFISRRGLPSCIYSDNGTNFVGASRKLKEWYDWWTSSEVCSKIKGDLVLKEVEWKFMPPYSPHFGGLWEAAIKSCKFHLVRVLGSQPLTYEELSTIASRVEAILNSRPLYALSSMPDDFGCLTPGHFLIGAPLLAPPEQDVTDVPRPRLSRWQFLQSCTGNFWKKWRQDYLTTLHNRVKWTEITPSLTVGTLVLLRDPQVPPLQWPTGRVTEIYPGEDGRVRVVKVHTVKGDYLRSVSRLSPLFPDEGY